MRPGLAQFCPAELQLFCCTQDLQGSATSSPQQKVSTRRLVDIVLNRMISVERVRHLRLQRGPQNAAKHANASQAPGFVSAANMQGEQGRWSTCRPVTAGPSPEIAIRNCAWPWPLLQLQPLWDITGTYWDQNGSKAYIHVLRAPLKALEEFQNQAAGLPECRLPKGHCICYTGYTETRSHVALPPALGLQTAS